MPRFFYKKTRYIWGFGMQIRPNADLWHHLINMHQTNVLTDSLPQSRPNHTFYRIFYFPEFVQNSLRFNMDIFFYSPRKLLYFVSRHNSDCRVNKKFKSTIGMCTDEWKSKSLYRSRASFSADATMFFKKVLNSFFANENMKKRPLKLLIISQKCFFQYCPNLIPYSREY